MLLDAALDAPDELLARGGLLLLVRLLFGVRVRLGDARLCGLNLRLLQERLELGAGEGRVLGVLVEREVLQLLLDRDGPLRLLSLRCDESSTRVRERAAKSERDAKGTDRACASDSEIGRAHV